MFFIFLFSALFSTAQAGGVNGGGSDHLPMDFGVAWFLDGTPERNIGVCFQVDPTSFPMEADIVRKELAAAFKTWEDYIREHRIYERDMEPDEPTDPKIFQMVTSFRVLPNCAQADLTIYLGMTSPEVEAVKSQMFDPIAIAHRSSYEPDTGWGKGFIWLRGQTDASFPWNLNDNLALRGIFIHELGHVLGNGHAEGTIMDANFADRIYDFEIPRDSIVWEWFKRDMTQIDGFNELVQSIGRIEGLPDAELWISGTHAEREAFRFLTGRTPVGKVAVKVSFNATRGEGENLSGIYTVSDEKGSVSYPYTLLVKSANYTFEVHGSTFSRYVSSGNSIYKLDASAKILSLTGYMTMNGQDIVVMLEGTAPFLEEAYYPQDRRTDAIAYRTQPYRVVALAGKERHIIYSKYKWEELNGENISIEMRRLKNLQKNYMRD